ncbi:MAG: 3-dehydro-scyllo-inosose hydrolase [Anaerolineae bacterium]|jgi:creatinine amidohydrolase/Fe(II)-dependent formamide hydrolase-like protein
MSSEPQFYTTDNPSVFFENTAVGRLKKEIWEASDEEVEQILAEYGMPAPCEWAVPGSYIQTTVRHDLIEERRKNDIVIIPVGCTELHGDHTVSAMDTFFVSQIAEGVRRYFVQQRGNPPALALPPLMYGAHPYHHVGMPGNVIIRDKIVVEQLVDVMLGLWNDGWRKQIILNNHGQLWVLEEALHEFCKRYQLPGIYRVIDWHRAVREFFNTKEEGGKWDTNFVHADESETSLGLYLFPEMVKMEYAVDTEGISYLPDGHLDKSVDPFRRPSKWSEGEGHAAIELFGTPEGVVGKATLSDAEKAKRPLAAILRYLTLLVDEIIAAFPSGTVPPVETTTMRSAEEMEAYLREPWTEGWKSVYGLPVIGQR